MMEAGSVMAFLPLERWNEESSAHPAVDERDDDFEVMFLRKGEEFTEAADHFGIDSLESGFVVRERVLTMTNFLGCPPRSRSGEGLKIGP
jgi:hypothetical protein